MLNCINILVACIKRVLCNQINAGSGIQAELLAVTELLTIAANEEWILNAELTVSVISNQVKAWLNRKENCCWDIRFIWNKLDHDRSRFKSICFVANKNTLGSIM